MTDTITPPLSYQPIALEPWGDVLPLLSGTNRFTPAFYTALSGNDLLLFSFLYFGGFACLRINSNGQSCLYLSTTYKQFFSTQQPTFPGGSSVQKISETNFVLNNGAGFVYYFVLPAFFGAGATYVVPEVVFTPPSPCGNFPLINSFYDAVNGLSAYEFIQTFQGANNIFASIYKGSYSGAAPITSGFIGNFPSNVDGFNRTSLALPPGIFDFSGNSSTEYYYTNGGIGFQNIGNVNLASTYLGFSGLRIHNGASLSCGGNGTTLSYVETTNAYTIPLANYTLLQSGQGAYFITQNTYNSGAIDSQNACLVGGESCAWAFSRNQIILFDFQSAAYVAGVWIKGNFIVVILGMQGTSALTLWRAPIINFQSYIGHLPPHPLYNYARGVPIHVQSPRFSGYSKSRFIL